MKIKKNCRSCVILNGFALIEIIVALLIGSLLTVSLYQIYNNIQKAVVRIVTVIDLDDSYVPLFNQLEKDIMGVFIPANIKGDQKDKEQNKDKNENVFVSTSQGNLSFNFLTTGGLKLIDNTGNVKPESYIKRVFYFIEPDRENPGLFMLKYGQTLNLEEDGKNISKYVLATKLKQFEISFKVFEPKKEQEKSKGKLITIRDFNSKETVKKYKTLVPAFIEIKGIFYDTAKSVQKDFKFEFAVPSYSQIKENKEKEEDKKGAIPENKITQEGKLNISPLHPSTGSG